MTLQPVPVSSYPPRKDPPLFVSVPMGAKLLQISPRTLYEYIWKKRGPRITHIGRSIRIRTEDLLKWADGNPAPIFKKRKDP